MAKPETGIKSLAEGRSDIFKIDPRKLHIKPNWNSRDFNDPDNIEHVDNLAQSIKEIGVKQPLTVYMEDGKAWLSDGECRLRATLRAIDHYKAEIKTIPVMTESRGDNEADRVLSQLVRNAGKPLTVFEQGAVFKRLLALGWQAKDIASKAGLSQGRVSQILDLQAMPEGIKAMVVNGQVAATTAAATVKELGSSAEKQLKAGLEAAKAEGKDKVLPRHIAEASGTPKVNVKSAMKDIFEYADFDDSEDMVVIKMPFEKWKELKDLLDL